MKKLIIHKNKYETFFDLIRIKTTKDKSLRYSLILLGLIYPIDQ